MRNDLDQIEAVFVGTPLAGLPIGHGPSGTVLVAGIDPDRLHEAWQAADALAPVIGRRPVMVTDDFDDGLRIRPEPEPGPSESELRAFTEAAASSEPWLAYRHYSEKDEVDEGEVEYYARSMAGLDLTALVSDVALPTRRQTLERALYDRLLADADLYSRVLASVRSEPRPEPVGGRGCLARRRRVVRAQPALTNPTMRDSLRALSPAGRAAP